MRASNIITGKTNGKISEAVTLLEDCIESGHDFSKLSMAVLLSEGIQVPLNIEKSIKLYQEIWFNPSDKNNRTSIIPMNLFLIYNRLENHQSAYQWLIEASSEFNEKSAQYNLGCIYGNGLNGFEVDIKKAAFYYQKSADQGFYLAQHNLAVLFTKGAPDFKINYKAAAYYFTMAYINGYMPSALNLASLYIEGRGVMKSFPNAKIILLEIIEDSNKIEIVIDAKVMLFQMLNPNATSDMINKLKNDLVFGNKSF